MFQTRSQPHGDSMVPHKQILYCTTLLFLDCLYTYASHMDSEQFAGEEIPLISLIKLGCREHSPSTTVGSRDFVDGLIQRARDWNSWKLIRIGKFTNRCHGDPKNLHFCMKKHLFCHCGYLLRHFSTDFNEIWHGQSVGVSGCSGGTKIKKYWFVAMEN